MKENVKELLDKYFEGNTSCDEERQLRHLFVTGNVPDEYMVYRPIFLYMEEDGKKAPHKPVRHRRYFLHCVYGTVAASIFIVLGIAGYHRYVQQDTNFVIINGEKCTDVRLAKQQAQKAFADVSFSEEEVGDIIPNDMKEDMK